MIKWFFKILIAFVLAIFFFFFFTWFFGSTTGQPETKCIPLIGCFTSE